MQDVNDDQEKVPDIDIPDLKYPVAVVEYVEDIHDFYRRSEVRAFLASIN